MTDDDVHGLLRNLRMGEVRLPQGRVRAPVDFRDFQAEYIGIIYEGLLDYQLRRAPEAMLTLNLGEQPLLPLSYLESLSDNELRDLLRKLAKEKSAPAAEEEEGSDEEDEESEADGSPERQAEPKEEDDEESDDTDEEPLEPYAEEDEECRRITAFAQRTVQLLGWVRKPRGRKQQDQWRLQREVARLAPRLIAQTYCPGEFYIARSLGIRKGTGTFYTRPALTVPTVRRTLQPLVYADGQNGRPVPHPPEHILGLRICDPAMGSGSFLLAALRYVTEGLYRAVEHYGCLDPQPNRGITVLRIPAGADRETALAFDEVPALPADEEFRRMLISRLRRHVVERCVYGVDINPVAVELARLSLWIETMDPNLPFEFLDHKLKVGNSLVGCWLDRVLDYPILAWDREGGDGQKGPQTRRIKEVFKRAKAELAELLEERHGQMSLPIDGETLEAEDITDIVARAPERFAELHRAPLERADEAERLYREMLSDPAVAALRHACDRWCAVWFWPVDPEAEDRPLLTPRAFYSRDDEMDALVAAVAREQRFFHWEIEFPDVFTPERQGFDAMLANPPWETMKPVSQEFFTEYDPVYRTRGKQEALREQGELFAQDSAIQRRWLDYSAHFRAMSNWVSSAADPFDASLARGKQGDRLKRQWERARRQHLGLAASDHPFRHQGSADLNTFKMFSELMWHALRGGGRLGVILPSAIYSDYGSQDLRRLFLEHGDWEWLFVFENRRRIFPVHGSYKFGPVIVAKGRRTEALRAAFMRRDVRDWERAEELASRIAPAQIRRFSPSSLSVMELKTPREVEICERIYADHPLLGSDEWGVRSTTEFHMTNDSHLFHRVPDMEARGYRPDGYGRWINPDGDIALPLYEGRMIGQFDFSQKEWVSGSGRTAVWPYLTWNEKALSPHFLMSADTYGNSPKPAHALKLALMDITSTTNTRTAVGSLVPDRPCNHTIAVLTTPGRGAPCTLMLPAVVCSLASDFVLRRRIAGVHLSFCFLEETPGPAPAASASSSPLALPSARLTFIHRLFSPHWLELRDRLAMLGLAIGGLPWHGLWAVDLAERLRLRAFLDAVVAELYGLSWGDMEYIVCGEGGNFETGPDESDPVGFWRVDKKHPWQFRHTYLTLVAFRELKHVGLEEFCRWSALPPKWAPILADSEDIYLWRLPPEAEAYWAEQQDYEWHPREGWSHCELHALNVLNPHDQVPVE